MFLVLGLCLLSISSFGLVVDRVEDNLAYLLTLYDNNKALGEGLALKSQKGIIRSLERLLISRSDKAG